MILAYNLDLLIIFAYLIIMLIIGVASAKFSTSFKDYSHAPSYLRKNKLILAATLFATAVGGGTTFGISEKIISENLSYAYALIFTTPIDLFIAFYIVPKIAKFYDSVSVGDIIATRYGDLGRILTGIAVVVTSLGFIAAQISVSGYILSSIFNTNYVVNVILSYIILIIYTSLGGIRSVITNNILQFITMIIAIPMLTIFGIKYLGFNNIFTQVPVEKYSLLDKNLLSDTFWLILSFSFVGCYPTLIQRALFNKNSSYLTSGMVIKTFIYIFFIASIGLNALMAYQIADGVPSYQATQYMILNILPEGFRGIVVIGFLSAAMSTADTDLNVASISVAKDIIQPLMNITNSTLLTISARVTSVLLGTISILISIYFQNVVDIILTIAALWAPSILVPLIGLLYDKTISQKGLLFSISAGIISFIIWQHYFSHHMLRAVFIGTIANLIIFIIFYYLENARKRRRPRI